MGIRRERQRIVGGRKDKERMKRKSNSHTYRSDQPDTIAIFRRKILDYQDTRVKYVKKGPTDLVFFYCAIPCIMGVRKVLENLIRKSTSRAEVTNLVF